jgi:hypothetical protein
MFLTRQFAECSVQCRFCGELALVRHQRGITALLFNSLEVGHLAGLLVFGFGKILASRKWIAHQYPMEEPELVGRDVQANIGLFTGVVVDPAAFGGLFALVFAVADRRAADLGPAPSPPCWPPRSDRARRAQPRWCSDRTRLAPRSRFQTLTGRLFLILVSVATTGAAIHGCRASSSGAAGHWRSRFVRNEPPRRSCRRPRPARPRG